MIKKSIRRVQFTLIELLVVLGIIGILIGILLPAISGSIEQGRVTDVRANCRSIAFAVEQYYQDYGQLPSTASVLTPIDATFLGILNGTNPRQKQYFPNTGSVKQPFSFQYYIAVDTDYDNQITVSGSIDGVTYPTTGSETVSSRVVVISLCNKSKKTFAKSWD